VVIEVLRRLVNAATRVQIHVLTSVTPNIIPAASAPSHETIVGLTAAGQAGWLRLAQNMGLNFLLLLSFGYAERSVILKLLPGLYNLSQLKLEGSFCFHDRHPG